MEKKCPQCGASLPAGALEGLCPACLLAQAHETATHSEAAPFQPPPVAEVARLFPQLEIIALIGKGGMGAVYQARQPALDRFVALKILPPEAARGPGFAERFNREARALARLSHPNIVAVHEFGQVNGLPFFIMEFVDGPNLRQVERAGKLSPRDALQIVPQICEALQFAHDEGVVHRDIKPENILLDKKGRVKIADFGIAKIIGREPEADLTETKGAIGTPHYMAPEQVERPQAVDHRADIFALGVVFYEMLTGELPLGKFGPPSRKLGVDVRLDEVVLRALEKEPERRYQHASQVKTAVETIASTKTPPTADAEAVAREILARDYQLKIRSCLGRGWALVRNNFWPLVGVNALMIALLAVVGSAFNYTTSDGRTHSTGILALLLNGPLIGGLNLFFLKKIRGERVTVETAFAGFSSVRNFLHLFLANFVTTLLVVLGFICLILPGIYLLIAWFFALTLVIDKGLDFWSAMELSRKMVTKHWFKVFLFLVVFGLLTFSGLLLFCVGFFITATIASATLMYAYEDIFGGAGSTAAQPAPAMGPSGTVVTPGTPAAGGGAWKLVLAVLLGAVVLVAGLIITVNLFRFARHHHRESTQARLDARQTAPRTAKSAPEFGPVRERVVSEPSGGGDSFLNLAGGDFVTPPAEVREFFAASNWTDRYEEDSDDAKRMQDWARTNGVDVLPGRWPNQRGLVLLDGFSVASYTEAGEALNGRDAWELHASATDAVRLMDDFQKRVGKKIVLPSAADPTMHAAESELPKSFIFKTRDHRVGVLEITGFADDAAGVKIRYKLTEPTAAAAGDNFSDDALQTRIDAAAWITDLAQRDHVFRQISIDAARAEKVKLATAAIARINSLETRDQAALDCVRELVRRGLRKDAAELTKRINDRSIRDQALGEVAR